MIIDEQQVATASARPVGSRAREVLRFLLVGGGAAMLDLLLYLVLKAMGVPLSFAKGVSFVVASAAAYLGNKHFTFRRKVDRASSLLVFAALYASTLGLNVAVNAAVLALLGWPREIEILVAWVLATAVSAAVNFLGLKYLVFRRHPVG